MTEYASADDLTSNEVAEHTEDVTLSNGKVVKVRGLTRYELLLSGKGTEDSAVIEQRMVSMCMVEPRMTDRQVEAWQKSSPPKGGIDLVTTAIRELSGLSEGADKSDVAEVRD